jgi:hypothetical protein
VRAAPAGGKPPAVSAPHPQLRYLHEGDLKLREIFLNTLLIFVIVSIVCLCISCDFDKDASTLSTGRPAYQAPNFKYPDCEAYENMKRTSVYKPFHSICTQAPPGSDMLLLEWGNYAWGGYSGALFIVDDNNIDLYLCSSERAVNGEIVKRVLDGKTWTQLLNDLIKLGVWEMTDSLDFPGDDCSTAFVYLRIKGREKHLAVYNPEFRQPYSGLIDRIEAVTVGKF